jgi:Tfp pilus assembly protein PilF
VDFGKTNTPPFDAAAPEYRRKLWVLIGSPGGGAKIHVFWGRLSLALVTLTLAGWFAAAGAVYGFVRVKSDFTAASYWNVALPWRWPLHRRALGEHYIALGRAELVKGNLMDAARHFAAGVARAPDDIPARRELAIIYLRFGQLRAGLDVLSVGLSGAIGNLDYLKLTFNLLDEAQEDARILDLTQQYLPAVPDQILPHQYLALQRATAYFHLGNYDDAEHTIARWQLDRSLEGQILLARCDWERGYPALAIVQLEEQRERFPDRDELSVQLIRFYRDLGRDEAALNEALLRHVADPASPGPRIDLLYSWQKKGDTARLDRELASYLHDFSGDPAALQLLGWFASDTVNLTLARQLHALAADRGFPEQPFDLILLQTLIAHADYHEALTAAASALAKNPAKEPAFTAIVSGLQALAAFGAGDPINGETYLQAFLSSRQLRASDALLLARHLTEIGAQRQARRVLATAVRSDPRNQAALTELIHLDTAAGNLPALDDNLPRLLAMRKPSRAVLQEAYLALNEATPERLALRQAVKNALAKSPVTPEPHQ